MRQVQIFQMFRESCIVKNNFINDNSEKLIEIINVILTAFKYGKKILIFGNGGSASDSQHMTCEFINRLKIDRAPLPAISLNSDSSVLTSISNDYDFSEIFSKQIEAIGKEGDVAFGITTSGNSLNVIKGINRAKIMGLETICLTGNNGGEINKISDYSLIVPSDNTQRIQECHITIIHVICEMAEKIYFYGENNI